MTFIRIEAQGLRDAQGRFARYEDGIARSFGRAGRATAERALATLKRHAPRGPDRIGGEPRTRPHVADALRIMRFAVGNGTIDAEIAAPGPEARIIEFIRRGTPPHIIRPRRGRALRIFWGGGPQGAGFYFFREVRHPGTAPNDFVARALHDIREHALDELRTAAGQVITS